MAASCSGGVNDSPAASNDGATAGQSETQELVIGAGGDPWVDAPGDRKRLPNYPLNADVCETLVRLGTDFQLEPSLATDWEFVGDNTHRFSLDERATFSDGRPLTAKDVEFSLDYTTQEPTIGNSYLSTESTRIVDDVTVEVKPEQPNLRLVDEINHPTYAVLTPGDDPLNDPNVTCTGPFKVVSYSPQEELVVQRNENYWGEPAKLDKITFRFIPDETTRVLALQSGEVDLIIDVPRSIAQSVGARSGIKIEKAPVGNVTVIIPSRRDAQGNPKLLADPLLRRAVAASIDTESYVDGILGGLAEVVDTVAPPAVLGQFADLVTGVDYDPEEAERLLDTAGWTREGDGIRTKSGQPLEMKIIFPQGASGGFGTDAATIEYVQAQLREVGIDGKIAQFDPGAYSAAQKAGDYDLNISTPNQNNANPAFLLSISFYWKGPFPTSKIVAPGPDTVYEALIDQTRAAQDPDDLRRLAAEAMHELVDVEVGAIPLSGGYRMFAMNEKVQGLIPHPSNTNQRWSTVFISE
jgi:peptide/nickel transport system substrate-binding protein